VKSSRWARCSGCCGGYILLVKGIQGLGLDDVGFLAVVETWAGISEIPIVLLIATMMAVACAGVMQLSGRALTAQTPMSFGPFLAIGLLVTAGFQQFSF
jgi:leader peptidase (prepilin peptidase)/N-methyltransferase